MATESGQNEKTHIRFSTSYPVDLIILRPEKSKMHKIFFLIYFVSIILLACNQGNPLAPGSNIYYYSVFCDTCGNDNPVSRTDSMYGSWPPLSPVWATKYVSYSPDRSKISGYCIFDKPGMSYQQLGVFVYDLCSHRLISFFNGRNHPRWSPDGNYVSMTAGNTTELYELKTDLKRSLPAPASAFGCGWSNDSKAIYVISNDPHDQWEDGIYRARIDGSSFEFISNQFGSGDVFELDSNKIVFTYNYGFVIYDKKQNEKYYHELEYFKNIQSGLLESDLSPDRKKLVCEAVLKPGIDPATIGIVVVDLDDKKTINIFENTRYRPELFPRWGSNKEILISLFCVKEYSYTTWEIDLRGNLRRKVTDTTMRFY